ncbi:MAG: BTAD domain-containing putative transcriptional regulator, partial [Nitrospirota bacterium]
MAALELTLLGGFAVRSTSGEAVDLPVKKAKALLAYLALHPGRPQSRDKLATLLWGDSEEAQARHSLRQALTSLRKAIPGVMPEILAVDGESLVVAPDAIRVDAMAFDRLVNDGDRDALEQAVALYQGEFLEGFNPRAVVFDDWMMGERHRLRERAVEAMAALFDHHRQAGEVDRAVPFAIRVLALDPLREPVHRSLMELYAHQGRHAAALKQYQVCCRILERELGMRPAAETIRLQRQIAEQRRSEVTPAEASGDGRVLKAPVEGVPSPRSPSAPATAGGEPTLRQATILCAALTEIATHGEPPDIEERHQASAVLFDVVAARVAAYGGVVLRHDAETVTTLFGLPTARSTDTERALRAACEIHCRLAELDADGRTVCAGIGIASGRVLVSGQHADHYRGHTVTGRAVDEAAVLVARAGAGEVLASDAVHRAVVGRVSARGVASPGADGAAWRIDGVCTVETDPPGFVGREVERRQFDVAAQLCAELGRGQTFLVRGEAGIGKSRLLAQWIAGAEEHGFRCHVGHVVEFGATVAGDPIQALVTGLLDLPPSPDHAALEEAVDQAVAAAWIDGDQRPFLNDLLGLPQPSDLLALCDAMGTAARERGRHAVVGRLAGEASRGRPVVLAVEDIHWADPVTLGHLADLAAVVTDCPALLVMTSRVEDEPLDPDWRGAMHGAPLTTIDLGPLRNDEACELAAEVVGAESEFTRHCVERAGGNPLFLEQLLRAGEEPGEGVPDLVQSIVWARLDHLAPEDKAAAQAASVLGQRFSAAALRHLIDAPEYACRPLMEQRLVRPDAAEYVFGHALIRDAVYASLLRSTRRDLHRRAAAWFASEDPVLHAEHLDRGEDPRAAAVYLEAAHGQAAAYRHERALALVRRGMAVAKDDGDAFGLACLHGDLLRETGQLKASVAAFESALAHAPDAAAQGRAWIGMAAALRVEDRHDEALAALDKAQAAIPAEAHPEEVAQLHYHRGSILFPLARIDECLAEHRLAHQHAEEAGAPALVARALSGVADAHYQRGQMVSAQDHFQRCVALCREHGLGRIEVANLPMLGLTRFYRADVAGALEDVRAAIDLAVTVGNRRAEILSRDVLAIVLYHAGDFTASEAEAELGHALSRDLGARRFEVENLYNLGLAYLAQGRRAESERLLDDALVLSRATGISFAGPSVLGALALATDDADNRGRALQEGETLLRDGGISH